MAKFPEFEHHASIVSAFRALFLSAKGQLNDARRPDEAAVTAVAPFFALEFQNRIIPDVGRGALARFFNRLKSPRLTKPSYRQLADHIKFDQLKEATVIPFQFEEWRRLIYRSELIANVPLPDWVPVLNALGADIIRAPADLSRLNCAEVGGLEADPPAVHTVFLLWEAACRDTTGGEAKRPNVRPSFPHVSLRHHSVERGLATKQRPDRGPHRCELYRYQLNSSR